MCMCKKDVLVYFKELCFTHLGLELATKFIENSSKSFLESHLLDQKPTLTLVMKYHLKKKHIAV